MGLYSSDSDSSSTGSDRKQAPSSGTARGRSIMEKLAAARMASRVEDPGNTAAGMDESSDDDAERSNPRRSGSKPPALVAATSRRSTTSSEILEGVVESEQNNADVGAPGAKKKKKKNAPIEITSNKRQAKVASVMKGGAEKAGNTTSLCSKRPKAMDPRFLDHCGTLNMQHVSRNYSFLEERRQEEMQELKQEISNCSGKRTKGAKTFSKKAQKMFTSERQLEQKRKQLQQFQNDEKKRQDLTEFEQKKRELKQKEKEKIMSGKNTAKPYFHSDKSVRKQIRQQKLDKLGEKERERRNAKVEKRKAAASKKVLAEKEVRKERRKL
ncbi:unnamed protein product [Amoebophrya sp. A120]|nr:unnamed protein product [Amoebophrya sp. A120]|eukprot:GSA120T00019862001.1